MCYISSQALFFATLMLNKNHLRLKNTIKYSMINIWINTKKPGSTGRNNLFVITHQAKGFPIPW
jgi:hypothetical protein